MGQVKLLRIRMIVNITAPDSGRIEILPAITPSGKTALVTCRRGGLYKKMKVGEQLKFLPTEKCESQGSDQRVDHWLSRLKLSDWKNKKEHGAFEGNAAEDQFITAVLHIPIC